MSPIITKSIKKHLLAVFYLYWWQFSIVVLLMALSAVANAVWPFVLKLIVDSLELSNEFGVPPDWNELTTLFALFVFLFAAGYFMVAAMQFAWSFLLFPVAKTIKSTFFNHLLGHSHSYLVHHLAGSIGRKISYAAGSFEMLAVLIIFFMVPGFLQFCIAGSLYMHANAYLGLLFLFWLALYLPILVFVSRKIGKLWGIHADADSAASGRMLDAISNFLTVKTFSRNHFEESHVNDFLDTEILAYKRACILESYMKLFQAVAISLLGILSFALGFYLYKKGEISTGDGIMIGGLWIMLKSSLQHLDWSVQEMFKQFGVLKDALSSLSVEHEITDSSDAVDLKVTESKIDFEGVCFDYLGSKQVYDNFNLTIQAKGKIGIVGRSGSGKTTFVNLLLRFYEIGRGVIKIDGQDISRVKQDSLRANITVVPQEPLLFHRSIYENIHYARPDASREEVVEACELAYCRDFIEKLPEQYESIVGERGIKLSGGQRQRIAIARAILKQSPILIFDEATAALDSESEQFIQMAFDRIIEEKTVIVIAHRLSTLKRMDKVIVFDEGQIVEMGEHRDLIHQGGHYAKLWDLQSGGFIDFERDVEGPVKIY
jgi:ATP-binding cassette subfamily B protein